jgi:hypothetical protein
MTEVAQRQELEQAVPLGALFTAFLAVSLGFLAIPWVIGLSVGLLFLEYAHLTVVRNILGGIAAAAAGLLIGVL